MQLGMAPHDPEWDTAVKKKNKEWHLYLCLVCLHGSLNNLQTISHVTATNIGLCKAFKMDKLCKTPFFSASGYIFAYAESFLESVSFEN